MPGILTCGALEQLLEWGEGNFTAKNQKVQMLGGLPGEGEKLQIGA